MDREVDRKLHEFLQELHRSKDEKDACWLLLRWFYPALGGQGGNLWFATVKDEEGETPEPPISESTRNSYTTYDPEFTKFQYESNKLDQWPTPRLVARRNNRVRWGRDAVTPNFDRGEVGREADDLAFKKFGLRNCVIMPVPTWGRLGSSGVSFYADMDNEEFEHHLETHQYVLHTAAFATHTYIQGFSDFIPEMEIEGSKFLPAERLITNLIIES